MLEIILLASGSFVAAMFCVWVYRIARSWHASMSRSVKLKGPGGSLNVSPERRNARLRWAGSDQSHKPWGW